MSASSTIKFKHFPDFAAFILENHLEDFVETKIRFSKEEEIPLLNFLNKHVDEELLGVTHTSSIEFLNAFIHNRIEEFLEKSSRDYESNVLPLFESETVLAEDITLVSLIRRRVFRKMLPLYTNDMGLYADIMEELDLFMTKSEQALFRIFIRLQEEKLGLVNKDLAQRHEDLLEAEEIGEMGSFRWNIQEQTAKISPGAAKILQTGDSGDLSLFMSYVFSGDRQKVLNAIQDAYDRKGSYECNFRYMVAGEQRYLCAKGMISFTEDGVPDTMKGTITDLSKRQDLMRKLEESEELNKQVQAITHVGNWIWDIGSDEVAWSDEMYRIHGLEPQAEQITLERFLDFVHPEDRIKRLREIQESIKTLEAKDYLIRIINPDGKIKVLKGKGEVIINENKEPVKLLGSCQDITGEYNLSRELEEKEKYLSQLINNAPDGVIVFDENGIISLWNPKSAEIFGFPADVMLGESISKIFPQRFHQTYGKLLLDLLTQESPSLLNSNLEFTAINKDQKEFFISFTLSAFLWNTEKTSFVAFLRDITSQRQTKQELKEKSLLLKKLNSSLTLKNHKLEEMNKDLNSFNYVTSHDLQEPLRKIQIFAHRIMEKDEAYLPDHTKEYLDKILGASNRMKTLIKDLLTFSQAANPEESYELVDLNEVLKEVQITLSESIQECGATVAVQDLPAIWGIPFQMHQLFSNLISNALKYCHKGSPPEISIYSQRMVEEIANSTHTGNYHRISVVDNGIGFESKYAEKIFDLFQRLHSNSMYSGTGIGLAICKKIIQHHQGLIKAESIPGQGATFHLFFPVSTPASS